MLTATKSNSSFGNWVVWIDNTPHYFMRKAEADAFISERLNAALIRQHASFF